jgi:hypothetical protein
VEVPPDESCFWLRLSSPDTDERETVRTLIYFLPKSSPRIELNRKRTLTFKSCG